MKTPLTAQQSNAVLAALRLLATKLANGEVSPDDGDLGLILTNDGADEPMSADDIHDFADALMSNVNLFVE